MEHTYTETMAAVEEPGAPMDVTEELVILARAYLQEAFHPSRTEPISALSRLPAFLKLNVTFRILGKVRGSMAGYGDTAGEQLHDAVNRAVRDGRFGEPLASSDVDRVTIEIWVQTASVPIDVSRRERIDALHLGMDGVEVRRGSANAYFKPSVAITSKFQTPAHVFNAICKKAGLAEDTWRHSDCELRKTEWIHLCELPSREVIRMNCLRGIHNPDLTWHTLKQSVLEAGSYLLRSQYADGAYCYLYDPLSEAPSKTAPNLVRAAGCAYAMAELASQLPERKEFLVSAEKSALGLLRLRADNEDGGVYIHDCGDPAASGGTLGTASLLLLALNSPALFNRFVLERNDLRRGILSRQREDGSLTCTFGMASTAPQQVNFFPGQALMALMREAALGDTESAEACRAAFPFYRQHFLREPTTAFLGWHAELWRRAFMMDPEPEYADFVFEQIDWLLPRQIRDTGTLHDGGFSRNAQPPQYSSIVYTQAIASGAIVARQRGDEGRFLRYKDAFKQGLTFCLRLQLSPDQASFFANPVRASGGVPLSMQDFQVRSDVVQHMITLGLTALEFPFLL